MNGHDISEIQIGDEVNGYRIDAMCGMGGMGVVFVVSHPEHERPLALKTLLERDPARVAYFEREWQTLKAVPRHPNVVEAYDFGRWERIDAPYIVMELLQGRSLDSYVHANGPLELGELSRLFTMLGSGLDHIHEHDIFHRDIKPGNIFLEERDGKIVNLKIIDFGIAKLRPGRGSVELGTPFYAAPEQSQREGKVSAATDVFPLAAIVLFVLTGLELGNEVDDDDAGPTELLRRRGLPLNRSFNAWFKKCRAHDQSKRFQSASDAVSKLRDCIERSSATTIRWIGPQIEATSFRKAGLFGGELIPKAAGSPRGCADCRIVSLRCPRCHHRIDAAKAPCPKHDYSGMPPFDELFYCPLCGTQIRRQGKDTFLAEVAKSDVGKKSARGPGSQLCYSEDSKFCIRTGTALRFEPRLDLAATHPDAALADEHDVLVVAGRDVLVRYDNVRESSICWPIKHWVSNQRSTHKAHCVGDSCFLRIPSVTGWDTWYFETARPPGAEPGEAERPRAHVVPLPTVTLQTDRETIALRVQDKVVHYAQDAVRLQLRVRLPRPPQWVPAPLLDALIERVQVHTGGQAIHVSAAAASPSQIDLTFELRAGDGADLVLLPWGIELPVLKPVRRAASVLDLEWRDCRGEWLRLDERNPIVHVYVQDRGPKPGWRGPERPQLLVRLTPRNSAEDLPAGELEVRLRAGRLLPAETVERQPRGASWLVRLPADALPAVREGAWSFEVAFGTSFRTKFSVEHLAASLTVSPDGAFDAVSGSEGQIWRASGPLERLRVRAAPPRAHPSAAVVTIDRRRLEVSLTDSSIPLPAPIPTHVNTPVRVELFHRGALSSLWRDLLLEPFPEDFDMLVHQWGEPPELRMTSDDPDFGVVSRPNLAVDRVVRVAIQVLNNWDEQVIVREQRFQVDGRFEVSVPEECTIHAKANGSVAVLLKPLRTSDRAHWQFQLALRVPHAGKIDCEVVVEAVMVRNLSDRIYYDYGTSNTAVCGNYARRRNYLREPGEAHFVRSRAVARWTSPPAPGRDPESLEAPCDDSRLKARAGEPAPSFAVLNDIKTHFRMGQSPIVPLRSLVDGDLNGRRRLYQPREISHTFANVQESLAKFVVNRLSTVPSEVITALPIVLRGARRSAARDAIRAGFASACRAHNYPQPTVDATLDESTAVAMTTLLGRIEVPTDRPEHVLVIDVGGGTTDITLYRIAAHEHLAGRVAECVGFDGLGVGGSWVTERVSRILRKKLEVAATAASGRPVRIPLPGERSTPAGGPAKEGAVVNEGLLRNVAERAKKLAIASGTWQASAAELRELDGLTGIDANASVLPVLPSQVTLSYDELLEDPGYRWLLDEIAARAQHAGNVAHATDFVSPVIDRLVFAGQASMCRMLQSVAAERLATSLAPEGGEGQSRDRKLAVVEGLRAYCERVRGTDLQSRFRVAGLDNVVMCPVGHQGWQRVVLPRFHPLNVPETFCDEADVIEFGGLGRRQLLPVILRRPGQPSQEEVPTTQAIHFLAQTVTLRWDYALGDRENRELRRRYRYCIWVDSRDELKGAMFEHWDSGQPIRGVSAVQCERHPVVQLLAHFVAQLGNEAKLLELNALSRGSTPITIVDCEGTEWTTYGVPTPLFQDSSSPWYAPDQALGRGEQQFVLATRRDHRFSFIPITAGTPNQHTTYAQLARDFVERVVGKQFSGFPVVCGVKLPPERGASLAIAVALGGVDPGGSPAVGAPAWGELLFGTAESTRRRPTASQWWAPCVDADGRETELHEFSGYRYEVTRIGFDGHDDFA